MKKLVRLMCCITLSLSICGCGKAVSNEESVTDVRETVEATVATVEEQKETVTVESAVPETNDSIEKVEESTIHFDNRAEAYRNALQELHDKFILPDEKEEFEFFNVEENEFAIYDFDCDGREELIIKCTSTTMADSVMYIYEYDVNESKWVNEYCSEPYVTFFDNSMLIVEASHNQGYGITIWPYDIYHFDETKNDYVWVAGFECWDKEVTDSMYPDKVFPAEYDTDNAGVVYMIWTGEGAEREKEYYSQSEYDAIYNSIMGDAVEIDIPFYLLTMENIMEQTAFEN